MGNRDRKDAKHPRETPLDHFIADSKPAVWWNVKYKTRWLSDGSVMSGNPILTNFLWNELGRGVDLVELANWVRKNPEIIEAGLQQYLQQKLLSLEISLVNPLLILNALKKVKNYLHETVRTAMASTAKLGAYRPKNLQTSAQQILIYYY